MRFPAYGKSLWQRRLLGERPRVVVLLVGDFWKIPKQFATDPSIPRLAVKTTPWHAPTAERYDWRLVAECTVLAVDVRGPDEREDGPDAWDPWLWLLADVQRFARDVLRFTITEEFNDPPHWFAAERDLEVFAWLSRKSFDEWPPWWPYGDAIFQRAKANATPGDSGTISDRGASNPPLCMALA